ncbi:MAG: hypothetical protein JRE23_02570 [Deltaproteobacteria bacterium]|nr:hypothetical protein [Deltaproteobacteria bacterium]
MKSKLKSKSYINIMPFKSSDKLKTFIFCTSYINDPARYNKWINYFFPSKEYFGADYIFLINDGSENINFDSRLRIIDAEKPLPDTLKSDLNIVKFPERFGRISMTTYPGWWRSFTFAVKIAQKYSFDKIIHIESDAYVCSLRLAKYIKKINRGWTVLWSNYYDFPETCIQIICKDSFAALEDFYSKGDEFFFSCNIAAEHVLPFKKIERRFIGERYGVKDKVSLPKDIDYMAQVPPDWQIPSDFFDQGKEHISNKNGSN